MTDTNRGGLNDNPFEYRQSMDGRVFISWRGQRVSILKGKKAATFLTRVTGASTRDQQLAMARLTGNFKRGNERSG